MQRSYVLLAAFTGVFALAFLVGPSLADVVFTENWSAENVGDNANQLSAWQYESDYGNGQATDAMVITDPSWPQGNFIMLNPPNPPPYGADASMGIRSKSSYSAGMINTKLSVEAKVALNAGDGSGAGVIGFVQGSNPLYGYGLAVSRQAKQGGGYNASVEIFEFNNQLDGTGYGYQLVEIDPTDASNVHTFKLEASILFNQINFEVFIDDAVDPVAELSTYDDSPVSFNGGVVFSLASNMGQTAFFDDFSAEQVLIPEPSTFLMAFLAMLAVVLLGPRTKKTAR